MRFNTTCFIVMFGVVALIEGMHPITANAEAPAFAGKWKYQSYRPEPGSIDSVYEDKKIVKWSPPGVVTIAEDGKTGELVFPGTQIKLALEFEISGDNPKKLLVLAVMNRGEGKEFTNELQGYFVPANLAKEVGSENPLVVRGSIVQTSDDIAPIAIAQPKFTTGFFVLEPMKAASP